MDIVTLGAALNGAKKHTENYVGSHFKGGSNIQITNNPDGTQTISASGEVSAEDTVAREAIAEHVLDKANPHEVTATQVGLGNVNNTSDIDKPVSTAMQTALDAKANTTDVYSKNEVDTALVSKQNTIPDLADIRSGAALGSTAVQPVSGKGLSTNDYTTAEKEKLAAIEAQANKTVVDDTLSDSSTNPVQNKVVQALAVRLVDAGSKNLLKITGTSQTIRNVTFTVNDDGTVSVDGTNNTSSSAVFYLDILSADTASNYNGCILTGCPQGGSTSTYRLALQLNSGSFTSYASDVGNGATIHDVPVSDCRVVITVYPGVTVNNLIFKPMICTAEDYAISPKFIPHRPSYDELIARVEALEQAAGINSVRNMVNLTTETVADATETEDGEMR